MPTTIGPPPGSTGTASTSPTSIPAPVGRALKAAMDFAASRQPARAIEALAAAAVIDIQQFNQTFLRSAFEAAFLADLYGEALAPIPAPFWGPPLAVGAGTRFAYVLPSLVKGQAAAETVTRLVELHAERGHRAMVLIAEEHTRRTPPLSMLHSPEAPTRECGRMLMARLHAAGAEVVVLSTEGDLLTAAREGVTRLRAAGISTAFFVASPACPVQAAMVHAQVAPRQVNLNIGVPLLVRGMDIVVYHNPDRANADAAQLSGRAIELRTLACTGTDLDAAEAARPIDRQRLGVPMEATLLLSAANKLPERLMTGTFVHDLCAFLSAHPECWWIGVGRGDFTAVRNTLRAAGVDGRAVLPGPVEDLRPVMKSADLFLNEYPEGGYTTVMEAMACGLPVVAMNAGRRHAEHAGAALSGEMGLDHPAPYWSRVSALCGDEGERVRLAGQQHSIARGTFSLRRVAEAYEGLAGL